MKEWVDIFDPLEIAWCFGDECAVADHDGYMEHDPSGWVIHWSDRRVTRPSIHKALRKIAHATHPEFRQFPPWRGTYLLNKTIIELSRQAHVKLPRAGFDLDRARLRFLLSEYTQADVRRMTPSEQTDYKEARRWAARS